MPKKAMTVVCCVGALLITADLAAADRCHTPLAGTRTLTLNGDVTGYRLSGASILVDWVRRNGCGGTAVWRYTAAAHTTAKTTVCRTRTLDGARRSLGRLSVSDAQRVVQVVAAVSSDTAVRLRVVDKVTNRETASWPLPMMPDRVSVYGGLALLSSARRAGLYVVRLADGRIGQIGVTRAGDRPVIGSAGILYQDDLDLARHRNAPAERTLNFVPLESVQREIAQPFTTVRKYMSYSSPTYSSRKSVAPTGQRPTGNGPTQRHPTYLHADPPRPFLVSRINAMAMDGERVALAVRDPRGRCDYVLFWNVAWHYVTRLTRAMGLTCPPVHAAGGITNVAIAGSRAAWTLNYGGRMRVLAAVISDCAEWVVARAQRGSVSLLGGDGRVLAYTLSPRAAASGDATAGVVSSTWSGTSLRHYEGAVRGLSVDGGRVAVLGPGGSVSIETQAGQSVARINVGSARAVALRGDVLAALTARTIDVYTVDGSRRIASWHSPAGATSIDVHFGIAVVAAGRDVYAVDLTTGRNARIFRAPTSVRAQVEAPGVALQYNVGRRGYVRFLPMSAIEAITR